MLLWFALPAGPVFTQRWPWPYQIALYLAVTGLIALVHIYQIHRRGQTVAEAMAVGRAKRRRLAEARTTAREAAAALPWLRDRRLSPGAVPGVLVAPAPHVPGYHHAGYDIVLDSPGDIKLGVARQVMRLTRAHPKIVRDLVDGAPATVLRVPDLAMAHAARTILESAGATVSITDPAV
jgi:ribosomal protein L7/L12